MLYSLRQTSVFYKEGVSMNMDELRTKLNTLYENTVGAVAYFVLKVGTEFRVRMVDISYEYLDDLRDCYLQSIKDTVLDVSDTLQIINLSTADQRMDTLYVYDLEDIPIELSFFERIRQNEEQEKFSSLTDKFSDLFGYVITIGNSQSKVFLFRKHYPVSAFSPKSFFIYESNQRFVKLEKDMIRLERNFDVFCVDGVILIKNLKLLESLLGFHNIIKREATASVEAITLANIVDNPEELSAMIDDVSFARKLTKAASNSPVLGKIPATAIVQFVKNHPSLKTKLKYSKDEGKLHLDTKGSKKLFLKLLNDDYLRSELTKSYYDSLAKDELNTGDATGVNDA